MHKIIYTSHGVISQTISHSFGHCTSSVLQICGSVTVMIGGVIIGDGGRGIDTGVGSKKDAPVAESNPVCCGANPFGHICWNCGLGSSSSRPHCSCSWKLWP